MLENIKYQIKKVIVYRNMKKMPAPFILDNLKTVEEILVSKKSLARFGDGELDIINGKKIGFQDEQEKLAERLKEILCSEQMFCLIGVPDVIKNYSGLTEESKRFWVSNMYKYREQWLRYLNNTMKYCSANVTRPYIRLKDKNKSRLIFDGLKESWKDKDLFIVEGEKTRFGVGNDLLNGAKNVKRILCPAKNAFNIYDVILENIKKHVDIDKMILIALGPTATILAFDLGKLGYRALDIGHMDIEYEWFLKNVSERTKVSGKYINEVKDGNEVICNNDLKYEKEIVWDYKKCLSINGGDLM